MAKKEYKVDAAPKTRMEKHKEMKKKHPDAVLLYRVGDFYEALDADASVVASILGITLTKQQQGDVAYNIAGFPYHALDTYLPKIIRAGKRVAICDSLDEPSKHFVKRAAEQPASEQPTDDKDARIAELQARIDKLTTMCEEYEVTISELKQEQEQKADWHDDDMRKLVQCVLQNSNVHENTTINEHFKHALGTLPYLRIKINAKKQLTQAETNYLLDMAEKGEKNNA